GQTQVIHKELVDGVVCRTRRRAAGIVHQVEVSFGIECDSVSAAVDDQIEASKVRTARLAAGKGENAVAVGGKIHGAVSVHGHTAKAVAPALFVGIGLQDGRRGSV